MKTLEINEMQNINAGSFIGGLCLGLGASTVVLGGLALTQFWNPAGWVAGVALGIDAACIGYGISQI